jgi:hypothetical protein
VVLDPDPNDMPHDDAEDCVMCGVILGLALTLLIAFGIYKGIKYFELTLPPQIVAPHK